MDRRATAIMMMAFTAGVGLFFLLAAQVIR